MKIILFLFFYFCLIFNLNAYLDPGTGSYLLQLLIAGIAGAILSLKIFWKNICNFFTKLFKRKKTK
jgi:hypothetical protein